MKQRLEDMKNQKDKVSKEEENGGKVSKEEEEEVAKLFKQEEEAKVSKEEEDVSKEEEEFLTADGQQISISREMIAHRKLDTQSIMPAGIHQQYSLQELRDLISLLSR